MPGIEVADQVIPLITLDVLPGWLAGLVLAAPLAAMMSTLDSLLLLVSSSVVKDLYMNYVKLKASMSYVKKVSMIVTAVIVIVAFLMALNPPELLIYLHSVDLKQHLFGHLSWDFIGSTLMQMEQ